MSADGRAHRVTIVGAGAVGLACAYELARTGYAVEVVGAALGGAASAAAAGMLAPASEALLDGCGPAAASALLAARRRWGEWAPRLDLRLDTAGALHLDSDDALKARAQAAQALSLRCERRADGLWFADDAVLDPAAALHRLEQAALAAGAVLRPGRVEAREGRLVCDGAALGEGPVVVAAGWGSAALAAAAPELAALRPIKGQLLRVAGPAGEGPVVRSPHVYLAPGAHGWTVGATMEPGLSDLAPDPAALARLREAATALRPELALGVAQATVGVRAAVEDGQPLVGRSRGGLWLATGMRRNGWLLAPLVAEGLAAYLAGADADAVLAGQAAAWDPARVLT